VPLDLRICNSLVVEHLSKNKYQFALSVMSSESAIGGQELSCEDVLQALNIPNTSLLRMQLSDDKGNASGCSFLQRMVSMISKMVQYGSSAVERDTQTESADFGIQADTIDGKLRKVDSQLSEAVEMERLVPLQTIEERMLKYQRECEERSRMEIQAEVARVREIEISHMRIDEATKCRSQLEKAREELEKLHLTRLQELRAKEHEMRERFVAKDQELDRAAYNQRQKMLQDLEIAKAREKEADRAEQRACRVAALQDDALKQRASDLDRREAQLVRAAEQQKITNQECRDVERRKSEMDYAERVREVESGHKVLEDRAVEWQALRQQHEEQKTHLQECSLEAEGLRSELLAEKHKLGLAQKDLAMSQNEVEKLTTELRHLDSLLKAARADLEEALKDLEHQRGIVKRLNAEAERVAAERQLASETAESRLQLERESRTREREAYLQELGVAKEEARTNISLEQKRWAQDRDMYEKRERETHRAYLGIKEAAETEVSAHETTKARLEDIELQLHQSRQECQNLRTMYHDAKNSFATSDWRPDIKAEWPSNPAVYPQTSFPGSALVKHAKVGIFTAPQTAVSHSAVTLAKDSFAEEMDARRKREVEFLFVA